MASKALVVENPATGEPIGEVATFTPEQIPGVIAKADAAQKQWAKTPPRERAEILRACWAAMLTRKLAPALAAGCAVVAKPASATPLTAVALAGVFRDAGLPDGLLQVVPTLDTGGVVRAALAQESVRKLSFTGSTEVGSKLLERAAARVVS